MSLIRFSLLLTTLGDLNVSESRPTQWEKTLAVVAN